jgi:hypothetical protein
MKKMWTLALAALLVAGLAFSAPAATFKIGDADFGIAGQVRINAAYQITDKGDVAEGASDSETDFFLKHPGNSRLSVWSKYDNMTGFIEMGFKEGNVLETRHAFMNYDMGGGSSITIGQTYSALALHFAEQEMKGSLSLFGFGNLYSGRVPMIRYTKKGEAYTLMLELENTDTAERTGYTTDEITPALVGSLEYRTGGLALTPSFLMQQYELTADAAGLDDERVFAYAVALDAVYKFTNGFQLDGEVWYGENVGAFADAFDMVRNSGFGAPEYESDGDVKNIASFGGWAQASIPVEPVVVHVGGGYQEAEVEDAGTADSMERYGAFVNFSYYATPQFLIQPEIAYFSYGKDNNDVNEYGSDTYYGVHFRYSF